MYDTIEEAMAVYDEAAAESLARSVDSFVANDLPSSLLEGCIDFVRRQLAEARATYLAQIYSELLRDGATLH